MVNPESVRMEDRTVGKHDLWGQTRTDSINHFSTDMSSQFAFHTICKHQMLIVDQDFCYPQCKYDAKSTNHGDASGLKYIHPTIITLENKKFAGLGRLDH